MTRYYGGISGWNDGLIDTAYNGNITANDRHAGISGGIARNKETSNVYKFTIFHRLEVPILGLRLMVL